jgi:hypothetical protein
MSHLQYFLLGKLRSTKKVLRSLAAKTTVVIIKRPEFLTILYKNIKIYPGAGFLAASFLVRPFLPSEAEVDKNTLCNRNSRLYIHTTILKPKLKTNIIFFTQIQVLCN